MWVLTGAALTFGCDAAPLCESADLAPLSSAPSFAVLASDRSSSMIGLLDAEGQVLVDSWLDSGTRASAYSAGLGADVVLSPGFSATGLGIVARRNADLLTIAAFDGSVRQFDLRGEDGATSFGQSPNAFDALRLDEDRALVSRFDPAIDPRTPERARGNDVMVLDLHAGEMIARIDPDADVTLEDGAIAYARPSALARLEGDAPRIAVLLTRLSREFSQTVPSALLFLDAATLEPTQTLELSGLTNCTESAVAPGSPSELWVLCTGDPFQSAEARRMNAGLVQVRVDPDGQAAIVDAFRASEHPESEPPTSGLIALDRHRALVVADDRGPGSSKPDVLLAIDIDTGTAERVWTAQSSFTLGNGARDPSTGRILVPDADAYALHVFDSNSTPIADVPFPSCGTLRPRQVALIASR